MWHMYSKAAGLSAYQRDDNEHGGGDGSHNVGPHTRAVHEALEPAEVLLEEGAMVIVQHNLEMTLHISPCSVCSHRHKHLPCPCTSQQETTKAAALQFAKQDPA